MEIICTAGTNWKGTDCKAEYRSLKIPKDDRASNLFYSSKIIFSVNESSEISFHSEHFIDLGKYKGQKFIESGKVFLSDTPVGFAIEGLKSNPDPSISIISILHPSEDDHSYLYVIELSDGKIFLTQKTLAKLNEAIIYEHESIISERKNVFFLHLKRISEEWQSPWENQLEVWRKIQKFTETFFFSAMLDIELLKYYEQSFCQKWIRSTYQEEIYGILQSKFAEGEKSRITIKNSEREKKFDLLIKLVANECHWDNSFAACRTYGAIIYFTKKKSEETFHSTFNFKIEDDWDYTECVKQFSDKLIGEYVENKKILSYFAYYLILKNKILPGDSLKSEFMSTKFYYVYSNLADDIAPYEENYKEQIEISRLNKELSENPSKNILTIEDMDLMSGQEFEGAIADIFKKMGYKVALTPITKDQGVDIIAERGEMRLGIQTKCYTGKVGNAAIQEIVAGKNYYKLNRCMVVTNSTFTTSAIELAKANNVILWDRRILIEKVNSYD